MDDPALTFLVVVLSITLLVFLVLGIYLIVRLIQISEHIKKITEHAEQVADRADHISTFFAKTATPVAIAKLVSNLTDIIQNKRAKGKSKKENKEE
jgi:putative exporter of polyketide antibiotics